jgi:hypothetical protein
MKIFNIIVVAVGLFSMSHAYAHYNPYPTRPGHYNSGWIDRVDQRQQNQQRRIAQGIYYGQLSPWEIKQLNRQQRKIDRLEHRFKRDGRLSRREREILKSRQNNASRQIKNFKHNNHYAPYRNNDYGYNQYRY